VQVWCICGVHDPMVPRRAPRRAGGGRTQARRTGRGRRYGRRYRVLDTAMPASPGEPMSALDHLPVVGERRVAVRVTDGARRWVRSGHPWLFEDSITSASPDGQAGDLAIVFDQKRRFQAIGLYDPTSPIRVRIL